MIPESSVDAQNNAGLPNALGISSVRQHAESQRCRDSAECIESARSFGAALTGAAERHLRICHGQRFDDLNPHIGKHRFADHLLTKIDRDDIGDIAAPWMLGGNLPCPGNVERVVDPARSGEISVHHQRIHLTPDERRDHRNGSCTRQIAERQRCFDQRDRIEFFLPFPRFLHRSDRRHDGRSE